MENSYAMPSRQTKTTQNKRRNRMSVLATIVMSSIALSACANSQILDVSSLLSSEPEKTEKVAVTPEETETKISSSDETATGEATSEEKIVLRGPEAVAPSNPDAYPSLTEQPEKPGKTLNVAEKDKEIRELENLSKTHVQSREAGLDSRAQVKKPDDSSIFGLGWLNSSKAKVSKKKNGGLTPPEKLRLARTRSIAPDLNSSPDSISTDETSVPNTTASLRTKPILPTVPEPVEVTPAIEPVKKTAPQRKIPEASKNIGTRPNAQNPIKVLFSKGSRKLAQNQQKTLDEIARFRDNSGSNIYVLGFSRSDPTASNDANIDSQDLAISRANTVANGLRKRGFPSDQVVVQIIDELAEKGKKVTVTTQRVEVYFEGAQVAKRATAPAPKPSVTQSTLDFLKGKPFEYSESEN